jgi:hypothetical protein
MSGAIGGLAGTFSEIAAFPLTLGPVTFEDFEIPASLTAGGDQALAGHKYPGGLRTADTLGPDDHDIAWSGTFTDDAENRCQMLDALRRQGQAQTLSFSTFSYNVLIKSFIWTYERPWKIGYSITLWVIQDNNNPQTTGADTSFDDQINSDTSASASNAAMMTGTTYAPTAGAYGSSH